MYHCSPTDDNLYSRTDSVYRTFIIAYRTSLPSKWNIHKNIKEPNLGIPTIITTCTISPQRSHVTTHCIMKLRRDLSQHSRYITKLFTNYKPKVTSKATFFTVHFIITILSTIIHDWWLEYRFSRSQDCAILSLLLHISRSW